VARRLEAALFVCGESLLPAVCSNEYPTLQTIALGPAELAATDPAPAPGREREIDPESIAFLQLTSGSTGVPRAACISHRAAVHNPIASAEAVGRPWGAPAWEWAQSHVLWLPLHHDMGLVGGILYPLILGLDLQLATPRAFLARPRTWLELITRVGRTISPAPNFAYQLCVDRIPAEDQAGLDLSRLRALLLGAEMVRPDTAAAFVRAFAAVGLDPRVMRPCYGLAEATLAVTFDCRGEGVRTAPVPSASRAQGDLAEVVSVGVPVIDTEVRVTSPDGVPLDAGRVGEVRVRGPGVFSGYWNDDEATRETLEGDWLRTRRSRLPARRRALPVGSHQGHPDRARTEPDAARAGVDRGAGGGRRRRLPRRRVLDPSTLGRGAGGGDRDRRRRRRCGRLRERGPGAGSDGGSAWCSRTSPSCAGVRSRRRRAARSSAASCAPAISRASWSVFQREHREPRDRAGGAGPGDRPAARGDLDRHEPGGRPRIDSPKALELLLELEEELGVEIDDQEGIDDGHRPRRDRLRGPGGMTPIRTRAARGFGGGSR
jgi:hypothetical protein